MADTRFVSYFDVPGPNQGWYSTVNPEGFNLARADWATRYDPMRFGPFDMQEEAEQAVDEFLTRNKIDLTALSYAARHAQETMEADRERFPGVELAKRRFQVALRGLYSACATGNPPPEIVGVASSAFFMSLCAAYPTAGVDVFRGLGNLFRNSLGIPEMEYGEFPEYADDPEEEDQYDCSGQAGEEGYESEEESG